MKIVIDISESDYCRIKGIPDAFDSLMSRLYKSIKNGTPLPNGCGRLIDADKLVKQYNIDESTKYGNKNAKQQAHSYSTMMLYEIADMIDDAPTIIEADKAESEEAT